MQGGGALGAYQVGVYQAMHESGIEPDWVIGTSIGAINGAIIVGNPPAERVQRLNSFWERIEARGLPGIDAFAPDMSRQLSNSDIVARGVPGFFKLNPQSALGLRTAVGIENAAFYSTAPLRDTLSELVDLDCINRKDTRLTVGAVNVCSGNMHYFDSRERKLGFEHIMASGSLPPAFPAVRINGEAYWDGGIYSNTPIEAVFDDRPRRSALIFAVNVWHDEGPEPESLWQVLGREKDIQYASRANSHIARQQQIHRLRHVVSELGAMLPQRVRDDPAVKELTGYGCMTRMHMLRLLAPRIEGEDHTKDIDFTSAGIHARRAAGYADTMSMIARAPWLDATDSLDGVIIHDPLPD